MATNNPPPYEVLLLILNKWGPSVKNLKNQLVLYFLLDETYNIMDLGKYLEKSKKNYLTHLPFETKPVHCIPLNDVTCQKLTNRRRRNKKSLKTV